MNNQIKSVLKYPGGKTRLAPWIVENIPEHEVYLEPFFGAGGVFFAKEKANHETINDIDGLVVNFFRQCRDRPDELARLINLTPCAREEFDSIQERHGGEDIVLGDSDIENARRFAVRCWQGFGSKLACRVGWKTRIHMDGSNNAFLWGNLPETIILAGERLKDAQIENMDAVQLIEKYNYPECFIYADPPYLQDTRNSKMYRHEMGDAESHKKLLQVLMNHRGKVIISGYDNELYNEILSGWHKKQKNTLTHFGQTRTETLWMNYEAQYTMKFSCENLCGE